MEEYNPFGNDETTSKLMTTKDYNSDQDATFKFNTDADYFFKTVTPRVTHVGDVAVFIPPEHKTILFYFIIVFYTIMVFACLILNSFFAYVLATGVQSYKKSFYRIVWQLVLANIISAVSNIITTFKPTYILTVEQSKDYQVSVFYQIVNFFDNMADQLVMFMCLVIAAHRLFIFVFPVVCEIVFTGTVLNIILVVTWLICFGITLHQFLYGCEYRWTYPDEKDLAYREGRFTFSCSDIFYKRYTVFIERAFMVQVILFLVICGLFYLIIFIKISSQRLRSSVNINRTEREILKQAAVLFIAFQISSIVSYVSLSFSTLDAHAYLARRIVNTVELFAGTLTPMLFFITSKELREETTDKWCNGTKKIQNCHSGVGRSKPVWWALIEKTYSRRVRPVRPLTRESFTTKTATFTM